MEGLGRHLRVRGLGRSVSARVRRHDPGFAAARRAARGAIVASALFAVGMRVLGSSTIAYYAAFGCFSMLLFVEFTGPMPQRLRAQFELSVAWAVLVTLGTLAARVTWVAVVATIVVAFAILFSGVVSSVLAASTTALLLPFVIPVSSPAPYSELQHRLIGVGMASGASMLAVWLMWPRGSTEPLSVPAARVCRSVGALLRGDHDGDQAGDGAGSGPSADATDPAEAAEAAARDLRRAFERTPFRPTGLSAGSRALVRLVDELTWLSAVATDVSPPHTRPAGGDPGASTVCGAAAEVLDAAAGLLDDPHRDTDRLRARFGALRAAMDSLVAASTTRLADRVPDPGSGSDTRAFLERLDVSFRAKELGYATLQVAGNVEVFAAAEQRGWFDRLLGRGPDTVGGPAASARERARAHLTSNSVWLHNSLRGAVGLGIAVALANVTNVQHSFWVLLGTLSVLRSNALNTGQNVLRAVGGTVVGSIIGAGLLALIGHHGTVLWFILPVAILAVGFAPAAISFAAGQAAFTVTLVVLFSIGQNADWHIALLRVQDIALGCGVSLLVALFFWPRGASTAVDKALAEAYVDSATYLAGAVEYGLSRCGEGRADRPEPVDEERQAAAAARRLDDALRSYLAERGAKPLTLAGTATLATGVVRLRLSADAVLALWRRADESRLDPAGAPARRELIDEAEEMVGLYRSLAEGIDRHTPVPEPAARDAGAATRLVESVQRDLHDEAREATSNAVRIVWTGDYVDDARRLQPRLAAAAAAARDRR